MTRRIAAITALAASVVLIGGETAAQGDLGLPTAPSAPSVPSTPSTPSLPRVPSVPSTPTVPSPSLPAPTVPKPPPAPAPSIPRTPPAPQLPVPSRTPSTPRLPSAPVPSVPRLPSAPTRTNTAPAPTAPRLPAPSLSSPTLRTGSAPRLPGASLPSTTGTTSAPTGTGTRPSGTLRGGGATSGQAGYAAGGLAFGSQAAGSAQGGTAVYGQAFSSILRLLDASGRGTGARASTRRLKAALAGLQGCFYGLSRVERHVIVLRTGLAGGRSHSRRYVARRLGTSRGQVRRVERRAVRKLYELVRTDGCAAGGSGEGTVILGGGPIGPAELAAAPGLIAFGSPAYQASSQADLGQPDFSQLGKSVQFPSASRSVRNFNDRSGNGIIWAFQLLAVMLLVAIGGFTRAAPLIAARARRKLVALRGYHRGPRRRPLDAVGALLARGYGKRVDANRPTGSNGRPARANGQPAPANGRPDAAGGRFARPNGTPAPTNGRLAGVNGEPGHGTGEPTPDREADPTEAPEHRSRPKISV